LHFASRIVSRMDTSLRHLALLGLLPRAPKKADAKTLRYQLGQLGYVVTIRTVQRELKQLSLSHPIVCSETTRPLGWSWAKDAPPVGAAGVDPYMAIALLVAAEGTPGALPSPLHRNLEPHLESARRVLGALGLGGKDDFGRRFRVVPSGPPGRAPRLADGVLDAVIQATGDRRRLDARYRGDDGRVAAYVLDPLALVARDGLLHLVARTAAGGDPRVFLLHRFRSARARTEPAARYTFHVDDFLAEGGLGVPVRPPETTFVARVRGEARRTVEEAPLHHQEVEPLDGGEARLRAVVDDTPAFRRWLLGFGADVVVEGPPALVEAMAAAAWGVAARYRTP
jgi:predicted DNA-binding transcriptional regulator YafY